MKEENISIRKQTTPLSRRIIQLQEQGFTYDFEHAGSFLICVQTGVELDISAIKIVSLDCFMPPGAERRYLYALESESGFRGIMLTSSRSLDPVYP